MPPAAVCSPHHSAQFIGRKVSSGLQRIFSLSPTLGRNVLTSRRIYEYFPLSRQSDLEICQTLEINMSGHQIQLEEIRQTFPVGENYFRIRRNKLWNVIGQNGIHELSRWLGDCGLLVGIFKISFRESERNYFWRRQRTEKCQSLLNPSCQPAEKTLRKSFINLI